jgi:flagellar assembly protein FliH
MMKNISNIELLLKAASTVSTPVFSDLYEQNKSGSGLAKTPTTAQLKEIYGKAYKEGYLRGQREAQANVEAHMQQELAAHQLTLQQLTAGLQEAISRYSERTSQELLDLALDIAKIMIRTQLELKPDFILPLIKHAIGMLPSLQKPLRIRLHPDDAALVANEMTQCFDALEFTILQDSQIDRGGCLIESEINALDASNSRRWKLLAESLGSSKEWFEGHPS